MLVRLKHAFPRLEWRFSYLDERWRGEAGDLVLTFESRAGGVWCARVWFDDDLCAGVTPDVADLDTAIADALRAENKALRVTLDEQRDVAAHAVRCLAEAEAERDALRAEVAAEKHINAALNRENDALRAELEAAKVREQNWKDLCTRAECRWDEETTTNDALRADRDALRAEVESTVAANVAQRKEVRSLCDVNDALRVEVDALRAEVTAYSAELGGCEDRLEVAERLADAILDGASGFTRLYRTVLDDPDAGPLLMAYRATKEADDE